ncbi:MFS transporter [Luteimonas abyssi]|uniref:MFS transporter n=1 Tax=Luteimonas abyssi TaxID=1247514 RepID=UPI000737BA5F|nr:MFS transporter [Luteimonas abyssi]
MAAPASNPLPPELTPRQQGWILFALAMGGFAIGTSEFAPMGMMPDMVADLGITEPQLGHSISAYALGVVVGAPLLAILGARLSRRHLLLATMAFYALGNLASALAPGYLSLTALRFVAGLPHGAYFGVAALVAASISPPGRRGTAMARVMLGLSVALLVGNPLASWLAQVLDWRWAFGLVAAMALLTMGLVARLLPPDPAEPRQNPLRELRDFNRAPVWLALAIGAIGFAGMFSVFSYLAPTMIEVTGIAPRYVPLGLVAFGIGAILGNLGGGWLSDRFGFRAAGMVLVWSIGVLLAFPLAAQTPWSVLLGVIAVGSMGALATILQAHLVDVAAGAQTLAAASNHSAFNLANALGPWLAGMAITAGYGWTSTGYVGAAMAAAGLLLYGLARRDARLREADCAC